MTTYNVRSVDQEGGVCAGTVDVGGPALNRAGSPAHNAVAIRARTGAKTWAAGWLTDETRYPLKMTHAEVEGGTVAQDVRQALALARSGWAVDLRPGSAPRRLQARQGSPHARGCAAAHEGASIVDCPYPDGPDADEWLRGWALLPSCPKAPPPFGGTDDSGPR